MLESQLQRHLYLPRAADGVAYKAQAAGAVVEAGVGLASVGRATGRLHRLAHGWRVVVIHILEHFVSWDVEAGGVGQIINVKGVLKVHPFGDIGHLHQRYVGPFLTGLAENVALTGGEVSFKCISSRDGGELGTGCGDHRSIEAGWIKRWTFAEKSSGIAGRLGLLR